MNQESIDRWDSLFLRVQEGSIEAMDQLYREMMPWLRGQLMSRLSLADEADVDDIVQMTFCKMWERRGAPFDPARDCARAWVWVVARNTACDMRRRRSKRPQLESLYDAAGNISVEPSSDRDDPARTLPAKEAIEGFKGLLREELERLSKIERRVVWMRYFQGQSCEEVAGALRITRQHVYQLLHRSQVKLRRKRLPLPEVEHILSWTTLALEVSELPRQGLGDTAGFLRPMQAEAKVDADESIRRLYQRLGLTSTDPSSPPEINWGEFERLLFDSDEGDPSEAPTT
jgi:RNA polymerase sigma factor (sigma-70 family)